MTINVSIEQIIDRFTALVHRAEVIVFPSNRKGVFSPRGMQEWPKFRKIIYTLARPYSFLDEGWGGWHIIIMIFWGILAMSCLILGEKLTLGLSISSDWMRITLVSLFVVFSYWGWIEFFRDPRYSIAVKMLVTFVFLWIGLFARMDFRAAGGLDISLARTPLLYSVLVVPIMTFLYFTVINLFVLAGWLYQVAVKTIISLHYPLPTKAIRELIYCDIGPFGSVSSTWKIMDLPKVELQTIQKWAMANRDATEKRTVPTLVTFAILGLFANTGFFSGILDKIIGLILPSASDIVSPFSFSRFIFLALLLIVVIVFVIVLAKLFKNLAVQNLIIETCIVVEHAAIKEEQEKIVPLPKKTFLWRCLLDILSHLAKL